MFAIKNVVHKMWRWVCSGKNAAIEPLRLAASEHGIVASDINRSALNVLSTLQQAGFHAYLVGGSVRDLLMQVAPKDFDIATNARPEQVKALFRNARLIGRRFRLVHVLFGREIIEVATFRRATKSRKGHFRTNQAGMVVRDNSYGRLQDDVMRRDFTVNALYYDAKTQEVVDYVGGVEDLKQGRFRSIGDSDVRYREDPVRILRAIRLMTKLGLHPDEDVAQHMPKLASCLTHISSSRLYEELLKMLYRGKALENVHILKKYQVLSQLLPVTAKLWQAKGELSPLSILALENTDARIRQGKSINPAFLLSVLLWETLLQHEQVFREQGLRAAMAFRMAMDAVLETQCQATSIPKRITSMMREIWRMQFPLQHHRKRQAMVLLGQKRFRAAYDFMLLRAESGEAVQESADWWTAFQQADDADREAMIAQLPDPPKKRRKPKKKS